MYKEDRTKKTIIAEYDYRKIVTLLKQNGHNVVEVFKLSGIIRVKVETLDFEAINEKILDIKETLGDKVIVAPNALAKI